MSEGKGKKCGLYKSKHAFFHIRPLVGGVVRSQMVAADARRVLASRVAWVQTVRPLVVAGLFFAHLFISCRGLSLGMSSIGLLIQAESGHEPGFCFNFSREALTGLR